MIPKIAILGAVSCVNAPMKTVEKYTVARTYPRAFDVRNRAFFKASMFTGTAVKRATKTKLRVSARDRFDRGNLQPVSYTHLTLPTSDLV